MLKFFRKIRKNLLSEGRTAKYLKYALGEIILVMAGILLALQVNNWNENQKLIKAKEVYIDRLISELKSDTITFTNHVINVQGKADDGKFIMSIINEKKPILNNKEFVIRLQNIGRVSIPKKANNTFLDLQNSGSFKLFESDTVVKAIRNYYITDLDFWYSKYVERTTEGFLPIVTDILPFRINEEIMRSEIKQNQYINPIMNYESFDVSVSNADLELILEKIYKHNSFDFHLKNGTRAHLLQVRIDYDSFNQAVALIELLKQL